MISRIFFIVVFLPFICFTQTLTGRVIDKNTQQPIETASVYFDNTTVGTTTDSKGEFSISYTDAIQSTLVISYLGYEKILISDFRSRKDLIIEMIEANNELDEVLIQYDDGLTRRQKLKLFRKEFLGVSKFGKSCKILNEDDIILHYDKSEMTLYASALKPLQIKNKALQYQIDFDIKAFEIKFRYVNAKTSSFSISGVLFTGTSFYKDLKNSGKKKTQKNRDLAYKGSVQHFMRSLYRESLREEGYWIFHKSFRVEEWSFFKVETVADSNFKKVTLKDKVSILYNENYQSEIELSKNITEFFVDTFGYYVPIIGVYFNGHMGSQRIGDTLPLDYGTD